MSTKDTPADVAGPFVMPPEDQLGMSIADVLRDYFDASRRLLERCEVLAGTEGADAVNAITAASRLLRSNAQMAFGAARVARIETRRRSFTEKIQSPAALQRELNSKKITHSENEGARQELLDRLDRMAAEKEFQGHLDFIASSLGVPDNDVFTEVRAAFRYPSRSAENGDDDEEEY